MPPLRPRTKADREGVLLVLDNGVRIESRSPNPARRAGSYILVVDADGYEIGYWNAEEWRDEPEQVMGAILSLAATGKMPERQKDEGGGPENPDPLSTDGLNATLAAKGVPFVIEENSRQFLDSRQLKPLTEVGPKQSGNIQEFEKDEKKK